MASSAQLDRWATWLDLETSYSMGKFPASEQLKYFQDGVNDADYSWAESSVGYLLRASKLVELTSRPQITRKIIQGLGKSAHNRLTCAAVARVHWGMSRTLLDAYFDVQDEWRDALLGDVVLDDFVLGPSLIEQQSAHFVHLQRLQDSGQIDAFFETLRGISLPINVGFIAMSERSGWVQPGRSSSEDVVLWGDGGDGSVEAVPKEVNDERGRRS